MSGARKALAWVLCACASGTFAHAVRPTHQVIVKERVDNAPPNAIVRVQLVYSKGQIGDSGEVTLENSTFTIKIPFYTQSRAPLLNGNLGEKCNRKPISVIVSLVAGEHEYDRISLDLAKDFSMPYPSAYRLRSEIVLHGDVH